MEFNNRIKSDVDCGNNDTPLTPSFAPKGSLRKGRSIPGTSNIVCGYRIRKYGPKRRESRYENKDDVFYDSRDDKELRKFLLNWEFREHTDRKIRGNRLLEFVNEGLGKYEETLENRRKKLRELLLEEEEYLTREIQEKKLQELEVLKETKRNEERNRLEKEQKEECELVCRKRMQQYLARSHEARLEFSRNCIKNVKLANLQQISEKRMREKVEKDIDDFYDDLMAKQASEYRETDKKRKLEKLEALKSLKREYENCIRSKLKNLENSETSEIPTGNLLEQFGNKEEDQGEKMKTKERYKLDLQQQWLEKKGKLEEETRREETIDRLILETTRKELEREKQKLKQDSSDFRKEVLSYMKSLDKFEKDRSKQEQELERIVEEFAEKNWRKYAMGKKAMAENREELRRRVLEERDKQLEFNLERKRLMELEKIRDRENLEEEVQAFEAMEEEKRRKKSEAARKYVEELREAMGEKLKKEKVENQDETAKDVERFAGDERITETLLNASEIVVSHPLKVQLKECAARRAADQRRVCGCLEALPFI